MPYPIPNTYEAPQAIEPIQIHGTSGAADTYSGVATSAIASLANIDKPTDLNIDISYGFKGEGDGGKITVEVAGESFKNKVSNTGLFVKEPGQDSRLENFKSFRLGVINFPESGYYDVKVTVEPEKNEQIDFQWIWLGQ